MNLAFDIGGKSTKFAFFEENKIIRREIIDYSDNLIDVHALLRLIDQKLEIYFDEIKVDNICISSPGTIDSVTGNNSGLSAIENLSSVNLKKYIEQKYKINTYIENDANCAGIAEMKLGAASKYSNGIIYVVGTGVGGFVFANGKPIKGKTNMSGEIGYQLFSEYPDVKNLSQACGMNSLELKYLELSGNKKNGYEIFQSIDVDESSKMAINWQINNLAKNIFNISCVLNPEIVLIGGAISKNKMFIEMVQKKCTELETLLSANLEIKIDNCEFENDANLIGANQLPKINGI